MSNVSEQGEMRAMRYRGELQFDDGDVIEVKSFIIRNDVTPAELSFDIVATWSGHGRWRRSAVLKKSSGIYASAYGPSVQVETGEEGEQCKLSFSITDEGGDFISVSGNWAEEGETYSFCGDLEVVR